VAFTQRAVPAPAGPPGDHALRDHALHDKAAAPGGAPLLDGPLDGAAGEEPSGDGLSLDGVNVGRDVPGRPRRSRGSSASRRVAYSAEFHRLWVAAGISSTGDGLVLVALPLLAFSVTRNPLLIAGVVASNKVVSALTAVPAGMLVDRAERRRVMWLCNLLSGTGLAALLAVMSAHLLHIVVVYAVSAVIAACATTYNLAVQGVTPDLVGDPASLGRANARMMAATVPGEQFVGQAAGGVLFAVASRLPFLLDSVSFFISCWLIRVIVPPRVRGLHFSGHPADGTSHAARRLPGARSGFKANLAEGFRLWAKRKGMKQVTALVGVTVFTQGMVLGQLVLYGRSTLHLSSSGYGLFLTIAAALGVAGIYAGGKLQQAFGSAKVMIIGLAFVALSYLGLSMVHQWVVAALVFGLQDFGICVGNVGSLTSRQRLLPRHEYGRVVGVYRLIVASASPVGAVLAGVLTSVAGVRTSMAVAGAIVTLDIVFISPFVWRALRDAEVPSAVPA
jgi:MFS family permease